MQVKTLFSHYLKYFDLNYFFNSKGTNLLSPSCSPLTLIHLGLDPVQKLFGMKREV